MLIFISVVGLGLFLWPFFGQSLPASTPAFALVAAATLALGAVEVFGRRLDARRLALLAAITAFDSVLRLELVIGVEGFSPIFFLILCAGYIYGPTYGFLCGASTMLVSAVITGGVGPWLPYEMLGVGWVGAVAGLAGQFRGKRIRNRDIVTLAGVGLLMGFVYGALLDTWDWTMFRGTAGLGWSPGLNPATTLLRFSRFYLTTSVLYDSFRAAGNVVMVVLLGRPVLAALQRLRQRSELIVLEEPA